MIYLNSAETCRLRPKSVSEEMVRALQKGEDRETVGHVKDLLKDLFGAADRDHVVLTSGIEEAVDQVISRVLDFGDTAMTTFDDSPFVFSALDRLTRRVTDLSSRFYFRSKNGWKIKTGYSVAGFAVDGNLDYEDMRKGIVRQRPKLVIAAHASAVTGRLTDLRYLSRCVHQNGGLLAADLTQTAGIFDLNLEKEDVDIVILPGDLGLFGPKGTGAVILGKRVPPHVSKAMKDHLIWQDLCGLNAGLCYLNLEGISHIRQRELKLAMQFAKSLREIAGVRLYGNYDHYQKAPIVSFGLRGLGAAALNWELLRAGVECACGDLGRPYVMRYYGTDQTGMVRASFSSFNTEEEVEETVGIIRNLALRKD